MKLENRYVVLKHKDLDKCLSNEEVSSLRALCSKVNRYRYNRKAAPLTGLYIEKDWPEYEPTLHLLEARVDNTDPPAIVYPGQLAHDVLLMVRRLQESAELTAMGAAGKFTDAIEAAMVTNCGVSAEVTPDSVKAMHGSPFQPRTHSHYFKDVYHLDFIDVYRVLKLFDVTDPAIAHAVKKLLVPGKRGAGKDLAKDLTEARDSIQRAVDMLKEDGESE